MKNLYIVVYKGDPEQSIETITDDPYKWLEEHNEARLAQNEMTECRDDFLFTQKTPDIYKPLITVDEEIILDDLLDSYIGNFKSVKERTNNPHWQKRIDELETLKAKLL